MEPFWERCSLKHLGILWSLKEEIKKDFFDAVPVEAKKDYTDLLEQVGEELRSQERITNDRYIHKEKIRVYKLKTKSCAGRLSFCSYALRFLLMLIRIL
jgi:hypothetical protein